MNWTYNKIYFLWTWIYFQVKLLESLQKMDRETFETNFASEMTFTTVLSDQTEVTLTGGGSEVPVSYEDRMEYCRLVQAVRMNENKEQVRKWLKCRHD